MKPATQPAENAGVSGEGKAKTRGRRWRRRAAVFCPLLVSAWLLFGQFYVRKEIRARLARTLDGQVTVSWAVLWPNLDASAFGVTVAAPHHTLQASRLTVGLRLLGLFGGRVVERLDIHDLTGEFDEGEPVQLFTWSAAAAQQAAAAADDEEAGTVTFDLAPMRLPALDFHDPRVVLRSGAERWTVFMTTSLTSRQVGDRAFRIEAEPGILAEVPFEKLTARLIPRAGHLLLSQLKLRAFNGMLGGLLDIDTAQTGAFNGEIECSFVEVEEVWTTYGLPYAEKRRGDVSGRIVFRGARPELKALAGKGTLRLDHASFFSPLSFRVFLFLKVPVAAEAPLTSGTMTFSFEKSLFYLEAARFQARGFELEGQGILSFGGGVDLEVSHAGTTVAVSGRLEDPSIKVLPLNHVTVPFDRLFRERVK